MQTRFPRTQRYILLILFLFASASVVAQDVAFFTSLKGSVVLKRAGEQPRSAVLLDKLTIGDEIQTGENGSAAIMFYSGKELRLAKKETFTVTKDKESPGFLKRIASILSGLIWDTTQARIATGGTRGGLTMKRAIRALAPGSISGLKLRYQEDISFRWDDTKPSGETEYHLRIRKSAGAFDTTIAVKGSTVFVASSSGLGLEQSAAYIWSVKDEKTNDGSRNRRFSFLSPKEEAELETELLQIEEQATGDGSDAQIALLSAALYWQYELYNDIEGLLISFTVKHPEFLPAYEILVAVYDKLEMDERAADTKKIIQSVIRKSDDSQ
jgi:hypothetical protein